MAYIAVRLMNEGYRTAFGKTIASKACTEIKLQTDLNPHAANLTSTGFEHASLAGALGVCCVG